MNNDQAIDRLTEVKEYLKRLENPNEWEKEALENVSEAISKLIPF